MVHAILQDAEHTPRPSAETSGCGGPDGIGPAVTRRYASVAVFPGTSADSVATQLASILSFSSEGVFGSAV